jgi:hypothetical protein
MRHPNRPMHAHSTLEYLIVDTFYPLQIAHSETRARVEKYALLTPQHLLILVSCDIARQRPRRSKRGRQRQLLALSMPNAAAQGVNTSSYVWKTNILTRCVTSVCVCICSCGFFSTISVPPASVIDDSGVRGCTPSCFSNSPSTSGSLPAIDGPGEGDRDRPASFPSTIPFPFFSSNSMEDTDGDLERLRLRAFPRPGLEATLTGLGGVTSPPPIGFVPFGVCSLISPF